MAAAFRTMCLLMFLRVGAVAGAVASTDSRSNSLEVAGPPGDSTPPPKVENGKCKHRCGEYDLRRKLDKWRKPMARIEEICQCNPKCAEKRDCCDDYYEACMGGHKPENDGKVNDPLNLETGFKFWAIATIIFAAVAGAAWLVNGAQCNFSFKCAPPPQIQSLPEHTDLTLQPSWYSMKFADPDVEKYWLSWVEESNIVSGAKSLLCSTGILILGLALQFQQQMVSPTNCLKFEEKGVAWVINFACLLVLMVSCLSCMWMPISALYWGIVCFSYFYIPAVCLPPLSASCAEVKQCSNEMYARSIQEAYQHADCSLQGISAMQLLMTWILFQPWVITKYDYMHSIFLWLFGVCLGWSFLFRGMFNENVFDLAEISYATMVLAVTLLISIRNAFRIEKSQRVRFVEDIKQRIEGRKMFAILECMMPTHVVGPMLANHMSGKHEPIADEVEIVSILFIVLADFHTVTARMTHTEILRFLNKTFTAFDKICQHRGVTKIETVGEEYVACVGVLPKDKEENAHKGHEVLLSRLLDASHAILMLQTAEVQFKMGIHTGPIVAGVIGTKLPRYRLFGDTINSAARMMQKGVNASVQFGDETYNHLPDSLKDLVESRGKIEMKGKGMVNCYTSRPPGQKLQAKERKTMQSMKAMMKTMTVLKTAKDKLPSIAAPFQTMGLTDTGDVPLIAIRSVASLEKRSMDTPRKEEAELEMSQRFEETLRNISKEDESEVSFGFLTSRKGFTDTMEKEWFQHYHERVIFRKSQRRFGLTAIALMLLSGGELYFMYQQKIWIFPHSLYSKRWRWPAFVMSRFSAIFVTVLWWYSVDSSKWVKSNPRKVQGLLLIYVWASVFLVYMSYDALTFSNHDTYVYLSAKVFRAPADIWFSCNFILLYYLAMRMHALLFSTSLLFLPLTVFLVMLHRIVNAAYKSDPALSKWDSCLSMQGQFLIIAHTFMNIAVAHEDEQTSRARFKARYHIRQTNKSSNDLLVTLLPPLVVEELRSAPELSPPPSHQYRHATIAQSDLCGFTALASRRSPTEVVAFMEELFTSFDELTDVHQVYKVETVGDAYIAGVGEQPLTVWNSPASVVLFGLDMVRAVDRWASGMGVSVRCRVGIHYGECIGGIVGNDMQRYHLFGEFLTRLEILESTSAEGRVQLSKACREEVVRQLRDDPTAQKDEELWFARREDPELKTSKGEVHKYSEVGGRTYLVETSPDPR